jgi:hypothetical protein
MDVRMEQVERGEGASELPERTKVLRLIEPNHGR